MPYSSRLKMSATHPRRHAIGSRDQPPPRRSLVKIGRLQPARDVDQGRRIRLPDAARRSCCATKAASRYRNGKVAKDSPRNPANNAGQKRLEIRPTRAIAHRARVGYVVNNARRTRRSRRVRDSPIDSNGGCESPYWRSVARARSPSPQRLSDWRTKRLSRAIFAARNSGHERDDNALGRSRARKPVSRVQSASAPFR